MFRDLARTKEILVKNIFNNLLMWAYAILFFILGLCIGSFLNVVILRMDNLKSIFKERSHCPKCKKIIKWYDLIPFLSFIILKGKCRSCGAKISYQYPLVELSAGIVFFALYLFSGLSWNLIFYLIVFSLLIIIFVYDIRYQLILESFSWATLIIVLLGSWYFSGVGVYGMLLGGIVGAVLPAFLVIISREKWMGAGDIKLAFLLGALIGYPQALLMIFLSFILGSIIGLIYIILKRKKFKDSLPFAPFLISATFIVLIWGEVVINWYKGYLLF